MTWLQRHLYFLDFTLSSLLRRKWKNISLTVVYALIVFLITSVLFFASAIRREADAVLEDSPELIVQKVIAGRHDLIPDSYGEKIKNIRGIRKVQGRLWGYYFHQASGSNYTLMATGDFPIKDDEAIIGAGVLRTWGTIRDNRIYVKAYTGRTRHSEDFRQFQRRYGSGFLGFDTGDRVGLPTDIRDPRGAFHRSGGHHSQS